MKKRSDFYLANGFISPVMKVINAVACCVFGVLLAVKLIAAPDWAWLWVASPVWIAAAVNLLCSLAMTVFFKAIKNQDPVSNETLLAA